MKAALIITGGQGFIGSHFHKKYSYGYVWDKKIPNQPPFEEMVRLLSRTTIVHLAASTYLTEGYDRDIINDNIVLSTRVREIALRNKSRIVYASSAAVYNLNNLYAYSKKYNEDLFADCNATGLRFYNVYGPNDNGVVGKLIQCAYSGKKFNLNGGTQIRDFIYVDDVIRSIEDNMDSKEKIVEVGTGVGTSINKLIKMIEQLTGRKIRLSKGPLSKFEQKVSICPKPLKNFTPLRDGLIYTISDYKIKNRIK